MEFGDFNDLPETDQTLINKILFSTSQARKGGKRPQFSWIDDVAVDVQTNRNREQRQSTNVSSSHHTQNSDNVQPPINVLPPQMVPAYGIPIGFAGPPIMGYSPVPNVAIIPTPGVPVYPFPPQALPMPVPTNITNIPQMQPPAGPSTIEPTMGMGSDAKNEHGSSQDSNQTHNSNVGKVLPRRNKKKRPPGYYEKLEAQQQAEAQIQNNESDITDRCVQQTMKHENIIAVENNGVCDKVQRVSKNVSESFQTSNQHYSGGPYVEHQSDKSNNRGNVYAKDTLTDSHKVQTMHSAVEISPEKSSQNINQQVTSHTTSHSKDSTNQSHSHASNGITRTVNKDSIPTSDALSAKVEKSNQMSYSNTNSVHSVESVTTETESTQNQQNVSTDVSSGQGEISKGSNTDSSVGLTAQESTQEANETKIEEEPPVPEQPKKPHSWAGLFSGTKQAKAATVIYTAKKKESVAVETPQDDSSGASKEAALLEVVPVADDKSAPLIGDKVNGYRLNHKALSMVPRGLTNRKNWCYVNATLQALLACPPFYHLMKAVASLQLKKRGQTSTPFTDALVRYIGEFSTMHGRVETNKVLNSKGTMKLDIPQGATFEPSYVYDVLKLEKYASTFIHGRQEDAEEFLGSLLNGMHDELVGALGLVRPKQEQEAPEETNGDLAEEQSETAEGADDGWEQVGPRNKAVITRSTSFNVSPISEIFQGQIRSILHQSGQRESATLQPFFTLQLDIQSDKVWSVKDALENLVKKESLQDYTCAKTKQEIDASRRIVLEELPPVLVLHLKYFVYDKTGGSQKLTKHIDYNVDLEINKEFLSPNAKSKLSTNQRRYKLFAVVNHHGARLLGGHYTTYVYHCGVNGWIHIDDELVRTVQVANMLKHAPPKVPYLLYYRKVDLQ